jgi:hypothetical protein
MKRAFRVSGWIWTNDSVNATNNSMDRAGATEGSSQLAKCCNALFRKSLEISIG